MSYERHKIFKSCIAGDQGLLGALIKFKRGTESPKRRPFLNYICAAGIAATAISAAPGQSCAGIISGNYGKSLKGAAHRNYEPRASYNTNFPVFGEGGRADIIPASLGGYARNFPAGIYRQSYSVNTGCFNTRMVSLLTTIQHRYRRPLIITSGYRSPSHNIRAGGVRDSLHIACAAADIKIPGVNKYQLASYVRSLPNRGGVGLYCHDAVHVDIGAPREWNWCSVRHYRRA